MKTYSKPTSLNTTTLTLRLPKDSPLERALGDVDELIAVLNLCFLELPESYREDLSRDVNLLGKLMGVLAMVPLKGDELNPKIAERHDLMLSEVQQALEELESRLREMWLKQGTLKEFKYLFSDRGAAYLNLARAVCRRAERQLVEASRYYQIPHELQSFLNRLSDKLFLLSISREMEAGGEG